MFLLLFCAFTRTLHLVVVLQAKVFFLLLFLLGQTLCWQSSGLNQDDDDDDEDEDEDENEENDGVWWWWVIA